MTSIRLKIPTLVQHLKVDDYPQYYLRPVFLSYPVATHRRYENAVNTYRKEVKQLFRGYEFSKETANQLLWYVFNPEIEYQQYALSTHIGNQHVNGLFGTISFALKGHQIIGLPLLNNFMFMANPEQDLQASIERVIEKLLKKLKKEQQEDFTPDLYYSDKREFLTKIEVDVTFKQGHFKFHRQNDFFFFSRLAPTHEFDGANEVERVGQNLNDLYPNELQRAFYREPLFDKLNQLLFQEENPSLVLLGNEGVGKHTLIHEVVWRRMNQKQPDEIIPSIWHLDPTRVISGMSIVGKWQKRFEAIIGFIIKKDQKGKSQDRMLIDNPVALLRIGKSAQNNMTLSDVLKPYLEKRQLQLTILATPDEWKKVQEKDRRFSDLFQVIRIQEPNLETATKMVIKQRQLLEIEHDTVITMHAIYQLFAIHRQYFAHHALPGGVMKLMKQLAVKYRFQMVDAPEVREAFKALSGLEQRIFDPGERLDQDEVKNHLSRELIGQQTAVDALANVIHLIKARLTTPNKPKGSFLFIGPTGVGKTQAVKVMAKYLMNDDQHLLRYDMNEYLDEYAVHRLIGDEFNPEGQLTGKVRYHPFSIILLDEIEKAHPKVHNLLLQLLDDGRLTDSLGRTTDFSNTIIIMTSNIGAAAVDRQVGFHLRADAQNAIYQKEVEQFFRPELINRIDQIVVFQSLELDHILRIARLQIKELLQRDGFVRRTTILNISKDALEWVARRGYDQKMGGRALRRQIEKDLTTLSADQLIATKTDTPIIFNINYKEEQLIPSIQALEFINPIPEDELLPPMPEIDKGKSFYGKLLRATDHMLNELKTAQNNGLAADENIAILGNMDWRYYNFQDKLIVLKEFLQHKVLSFREHLAMSPPAIPLRLKQGHFTQKSSNSTRGYRENIKDQLFQKEALKEIREAFQFGQAQFDQFNADLIHIYLKVAFSQLGTQAVLSNRFDEIEIQFQSLITGMGQWEIHFLMDQYEFLFKEMDINYSLNRKHQRINVEGHALFHMLYGEMGIHLFYATHQSPLPIQLTLRNLNQAPEPKPLMQVIRVYDGGRTLTDLRTGFSNNADLNVNEFQVLLFAGIRKSIREELIHTLI